MIMAINKDKAKAPEVEYNAEVVRAHDLSKDGKTCISFDMIVNGVKINGCFYRDGEKDGKQYEFISLPSTKGKDGKYYPVCSFKISDELLKDIEDQIEKKLQ